MWSFTHLWCMPKETHMPNFGKIGVGLVPSITHFPISAQRAWKTQYLLYIAKRYCPRALQVGSFSGELTSEQTSLNNLCSIINSKSWKYSFIVIYFIGSWLYRMEEKCQYFTINVYFHNVELILEHRFLCYIFSPLHWRLQNSRAIFILYVW